MNILIKTSILCLILFSGVILTAPVARAELPVYAPINPTFTGGNPLMGQVLLNKAVATKEEEEDDNPGNPGNPGSNPSSSIGPALDRMLDRLDRTLDRNADSLGRALSTPINIQNTGGSGNSPVLVVPSRAQ